MLVLDRTEQQEKLDFLLDAFQTVTTHEAKSSALHLEEKRVNKFLDGINERKQYLREILTDLEPLMPRLRDVTHFSASSERLLKMITHVIETMEKLAIRMIRTYVDLNNFFYKNGIDRTDVHRYKLLADDLKETAVDLKDRFFILPADDEFQDLMSQF